MLEMEQLEEIAQLMPEQLPLLVETFDADSQQRVAAMRLAIKQAEGERLRETAHTMKGGAASVGASQLALLLRRMEVCGVEAKFSEANTLLAQIETELEQSLSQLRNWLSTA